MDSPRTVWGMLKQPGLMVRLKLSMCVVCIILLKLFISLCELILMLLL